jgi:hypothetical protein
VTKRKIPAYWLVLLSVACAPVTAITLGAANQSIGHHCGEIEVAKVEESAVAGGGGTLAATPESDAGASQDATTRKGATKTSVAPEICVERIRRGVLQSDWSRITVGAKDAGCVRVLTKGGLGLGYDDPSDIPGRSTLELVPRPGRTEGGGRVSFLVDESSGDATEAGAALANALDGNGLEIQLFTRSCHEICAASSPKEAIYFFPGDPKPAHVTFEREDSDCRLAGVRSIMRDAGADGSHD